MNNSIDLNADLGEGGPHDAELLKIVSSANICCGAHAGTVDSINLALREAVLCGVAIGAHPSYPDRDNFGRLPMTLSAAELTEQMQSQLDFLSRQAAFHGARFTHVKPHGALYNQAAQDHELADRLAAIIREYDQRLVLIGLAGSALVQAGERAGLQTRAEAFADRRYDNDGRLLPRSDPRALLRDPAEAIRQSLMLVKKGKIRTIDGSRISIHADTLCLHGDSREALTFARGLKQAFEEAGIRIGTD